MSSSPFSPRAGIGRRAFVKGALAAAAAAGVPRSFAAAMEAGQPVTIVVPPGDPIATSRPAAWAVDELKAALAARGADVRLAARVPRDGTPGRSLYVCGANDAVAQAIVSGFNQRIPGAPESLALASGAVEGSPILLAAGRDPLGLVYALTEIADRVRCLGEAPAALDFPTPVIERPASRVRSILRAFSSEVEDKEWYYDRDFWRRYLTALVSQRINRFNLSTGMGYNSADHVTDGYFILPYAFLFDVPGYAVRARGLSPEERERNLETLKFIADETARRGLHFQFGIWTQAYRWRNSPHATYMIEGLTDATQAAYCRDSVARLLNECPAISGLTFRVHSESGIPTGSDNFWKTLFSAVAHCGRRVEIDMHAKNAPQETLDAAVATGMPVVFSPKYCGEHLGLPYHPASIREYEMAAPGSFQDVGTGLSRGNRIFSRYGYADLFADNRDWDVLFRIWPGTRHLLMSGDPAWAAAHGRTAGFCGALGVELCEPLTFKGRMGSGLPGGRCGYADPSLAPRHDFEKFLPTYRVWGRLGYNPAAQPEIWRRSLRRDFGGAAESVETALAFASRALPLVTLSSAPSADCTLFWPEVYTNMPIASKDLKQPYTDATPPKLFGNMGGFDPQLFQSPDECGDALVEGRETGRYSPLEVAQWLGQIADVSGSKLDEAGSLAGERRTSAAFRRIEEDVLIQTGIALFFAGKIRSAVLWRIHARTGDRAALEHAVRVFAAGRDAWAAMARRAASVYRSDLTFGERTVLRGHWLDRLPAIDQDLADLRHRLDALGAPAENASAAADAAVRTALAAPRRPEVRVRHTPPLRFRKGALLPLAIACDTPAASVRLHYRHVNQAERWQSAPMASAGGVFRTAIPAAYTGHRYPLQYYFEIAVQGGGMTLFPALGSDLAGVPYLVVQSHLTARGSRG